MSDKEKKCKCYDEDNGVIHICAECRDKTSMSEDVKLSGCPYCAKSPIVRHMPNAPATKYEVRCNNSRHGSAIGKTLLEAIGRWEDRPDHQAKVEALERELKESEEEAKSLARAIYARGYREKEIKGVVFELCDSTAGIISQIDNMTAGLFEEIEQLQTKTAEQAERLKAFESAVGYAEGLAKKFHETYERLAPAYNYETRKESAVPWGDVPLNNRKLMVAVCRELFNILDKG